MTSTIAEVLTPLDPDASLIAARAAAELDAIKRGAFRGVPTAVGKLGDLLQLTLGTPEGESRRRVDDSGVIMVLDQAVMSMAATRATTLDELLSKANEMRIILSEVQSSLSEDGSSSVDSERIVMARDFAAALASASTRFLRSMEDLRPSLPDRP